MSDDSSGCNSGNNCDSNKYSSNNDYSANVQRDTNQNLDVRTNCNDHTGMESTASTLENTITLVNNLESTRSAVDNINTETNSQITLQIANGSSYNTYNRTSENTWNNNTTDNTRSCASYTRRSSPSHACYISKNFINDRSELELSETRNKSKICCCDNIACQAMFFIMIFILAIAFIWIMRANKPIQPI